MMFRSTLIFACAASVAACSADEAQQSENDVASLREIQPGITDACVEEFRRKGLEAISGDVRDCFRMDKSKEWKGLWINGFEQSSFCPSIVQKCDEDATDEDIWLSFDDAALSATQSSQIEEDAVYQIEFIGTITSVPGAFGHMGGSSREIVVERLIKLERLESPQ